MKSRKRIWWFGVLICSVIAFTYLLFKPSVSIAIQPFNGASATHINQVKRALETAYKAKVVLLTPIDLPKSSYYKPRNRYRADSLIAYLKRQATNTDYIIGLTGKDISTTKGQHIDWGIFGLGYRPGKSCIVSSNRLNTNDTVLLRTRIEKVAIHEVGHNLGLAHCTADDKCVMNDACGTVKEVDSNNKQLCRLCKAKTFFKY